MIRKIIVLILIWAFPYFSQNSPAQDSLKLLATMTGEKGGDFFIHCASAGDLNADGFMDIIIGGSSGEGGKGYVKIYFGSADFDTVPEFRIVDEGNFGKSVACAGDVNDDGYDDIIVSAPSAYNPNNEAELAGKAHIYFGGSPMDTLVDVILQDSDYRDFYGSSVASAGDVNGDNYDDVMVAAIGSWDPFGKVFIYLGGAEMDNIYDVYIHGQSGLAEELGRSLAGLGDVNGDEYDDILIGCPFAGDPWGTGKAAVYFGGDPMDSIPDVTFYGDTVSFWNFGRNVASPGDVDGDGIPDLMVGNTNKTKVFFGKALSDTNAYVTLPVGWSISSAGNVNQDGYGDIIASDDDYPQSSYIFYGSTDMDGKADIILKAEDTTLIGFGIKVAGVGDLNGDGYDEVMISSYFDDTDVGKVFIFTSAPTSVSESDEKGQLNNFQLRQNYPNPFNPETTIEYVIPGNSRVDLSVYNILGEHVRTLIDRYQKAGYKKTSWDGTDQAGRQASSGVYLYRLKTGSFTEVKKMLLLR